jgi:hypothetical protein
LLHAGGETLTTDGRMDRQGGRQTQTDVTKLTIDFRNLRKNLKTYQVMGKTTTVLGHINTVWAESRIFSVLHSVVSKVATGFWRVNHLKESGYFQLRVNSAHSDHAYRKT